MIFTLQQKFIPTDSINAPFCPEPYAVISFRGFFTGTTAVSVAFLLNSIISLGKRD